MSKRDIKRGEDGTLSRNNLHHMKFLVSEYERIKNKSHPRYAFVQDFYKAHNLTRQNFIKYYNRYKLLKSDVALLPEKRGPKYRTGRTLPFVENKVIELRKQGFNRFEIYDRLQVKLKNSTPKPSTIYHIMKRYGLNKMSPKMTEIKRQIIKKEAGELGHIDCHYLPKGIIKDDDKRYYVVGLIDSYSRIAWASIVSDIQSLTVMFASLEMMNFINKEYGFSFKDILTDNGSEFGQGKDKNNQHTNPFKRLLLEMDIKHRFTRPYRPQTNGKIERFWKTLHADLIDGVVFDSISHLQDELMHYMVFYNEMRPHQGIDGKKPVEMLTHITPSLPEQSPNNQNMLQ